MGKFMKPGKVVIVLAGRYAGRKAIIVKSFDEGSKEHQFPHALVAGLDKSPLAVTKSQSQKRILKRSRIKPFIKNINLNHLLPTRYSVNDIDIKTHVQSDKLKKPEQRQEAKKAVIMRRRLTSGKTNTPKQHTKSWSVFCFF